MRLPERLAGRRVDPTPEPPAAAVEPEPAPPPAEEPAPLATASPESTRPGRPKRDWRSMRFSSRFAQPPVAYDLDEVGDRELSFEPSGEPERPSTPEPPYLTESAREDFDVAEATDAALRRRFGRGRQVEPDYDDDRADDRYAAAGYADDIPAQDEGYYEPEESFEESVAPMDELHYGAERGYEADDSYGHAVHDEDDTARDHGAYRLPAASYDDTGYDVGADGEYSAHEVSVADTQRDRGRGGHPEEHTREQVIYDDFEPQDRTEASAEIAYVDERFDDFGEYPGADEALRAEPRSDLDAGPATYRGTFDDYEKKSRKGPLLLLASLGGVAVVAGGLIFAYQMLAPNDGGVPLVKVEDSPSKVAPEEPGGMNIPHTNKLIYDRIVGEETRVDENVVSNEEPVIDLNAQGEQEGQPESGNVATLPPPPESPTIDTQPGEGPADDTGRAEAVEILSGIQPEEPGAPMQGLSAPTPPPPGLPSVESDRAPQPAEEPDNTPLPSRIETVTAPERTPEPAETPPPLPKARPAVPPPPLQTEVASRSPDSGGPIRLTPPPASSGAPIPAPTTSIESAPLAPPAAIAPPPPQEQIAAVPPPVVRTQTPQPARATSGDYVIQTAAFRSEEEAQEEYRKLRDKHGGLLAGYAPLIQKADLGTRGIYYRLRLGPLDSKESADNLCDSLLAAGEKDCLVRRQ